jgi:hypothetical protein
MILVERFRMNRLQEAVPFITFGRHQPQTWMLRTDTSEEEAKRVPPTHPRITLCPITRAGVIACTAVSLTTMSWHVQQIFWIWENCIWEHHCGITRLNSQGMWLAAMN